MIKEKDAIIEELMEFKILKTSEEKVLKNETKKLEKRYKAIEERENKLKNIVREAPSKFEPRKNSDDENKIDVNDNEPEARQESERKLPEITSTIPSENFFEVLSIKEHIKIHENSTDHNAISFEAKIRDKLS
jgi:hypothetical protein